MIENGVFILLATVVLGTFIKLSGMTTKEKTTTVLIMTGISAYLGYQFHIFFYMLIPTMLVGVSLGFMVERTSRKRRNQCMREAMQQKHAPTNNKIYWRRNR